MWQLYPARQFLLLCITLCSFYMTAAAQQTPPAGASPVPDSDLTAPNVIVVPDDSKVPKHKDELYEDWSKPELPPGMQSDTGLVDRIEQGTFSRELIHAQWRDLDAIDLTVIKPVGVTKPAVILYLYSYPSSNDRYKDAAFCEFLTRNGFAAVGFVPALTEHRFHDRPTQQWFVSQFQESLGTSVHDVQMILTYLVSRGDLDMTRVGMWGDGVGASIAIMAAAVDPRIKVLDLLDPWGDWPDWLAKSSLVPEKERSQYLKPEFLKSVEDLDPVKWLPQLKTQQVRLQYIKEGVTVTPAIVQQRLEAAAAPNVKIVHYQNAAAFRKEVVSADNGFDWVKDRLSDPSLAPQKRVQSAEKPALQVKNSEQ
jgi:hypothetical protein